MDTVLVEEQIKLTNLLAKFFFTTGVPFTLVSYKQVDLSRFTNSQLGRE